MPRTVTALFDTRADAEAGRQRLIEASIAADNIHIHDRDTAGVGDTGYSTHEDRGLWELRSSTPSCPTRIATPMRRASAAAAICSPPMFRTRKSTGRSPRWKRPTASTSSSAPPIGAARAGIIPPRRRRQAPLAGAGRERGRLGETRQGEEVIPVVEEKLVVGKREVDRGGVRVRSYVTETPVHEQIRLREERVQVERRSVDRPALGRYGRRLP